MITVTLDSTSQKETVNALRKFGKDSAKVIKDVVNAAAANIESDAKEKIKADKHIVTNRLRASIHAEYKTDQQYMYKDDENENFDGALHENFGELEAIVGTNVSYASKIEFMYDSFLRWAAEKQKPIFIRKMTDALNKLIG